MRSLVFCLSWEGCKPNFSATDLKVVAQRCVHALDQGGEMILCHCLGKTDNPLTGPEASDLFAAFASARLPVRTTLQDGVKALELADAAQPVEVRVRIPGDATIAARCLHEALSLVEADGIDRDSGRPGQLFDAILHE